MLILTKGQLKDSIYNLFKLYLVREMERNIKTAWWDSFHILIIFPEFLLNIGGFKYQRLFSMAGKVECI